jgi:hypothetical protein
MRGVERVLAAILLVAAVGGAAVFARQSGSGLVEAVHLAAPPPQHLAAPGTVLIAPTSSADHSRRVLRLPVSARMTARPAEKAQSTPLRPLTVVQPRSRQQPQAAIPAAAPAPVAAPTVTPPRAIASAQPLPVASPLPPETVTSTSVQGLVPLPGIARPTGD